MISYLLRGIGIGLLFGLPAGAVGALTIQRSITKGVKSGLLTGLGSSVADCIYASIGALGLTFISDFLLKYQIPVNIIGGILIATMGLKLILQKTPEKKVNDTVPDGIKMFLSSFAVGITNPAAILTFLFAFTYFGISDITGLANGIALVIGVFIGT